MLKVIAESIEKYHPQWVVFDPVMVSTSGCRLIEEQAVDTIKNRLIPLADLITPNLQEAEVLLGLRIRTLEEMKIAARQLLNFGSRAVLLKGGHLEGDEMTDILCGKQWPEPLLYLGKRTDSPNTHGTGCTLSSAITTLLAQGYPMEQAVKMGKAYVAEGIRQGQAIKIGEGHGPLNHFFAPMAMKIKEISCEDK